MTTWNATHWFIIAWAFSPLLWSCIGMAWGKWPTFSFAVSELFAEFPILVLVWGAVSCHLVGWRIIPK